DRQPGAREVVADAELHRKLDHWAARLPGAAAISPAPTLLMPGAGFEPARSEEQWFLRPCGCAIRLPGRASDRSERRELLARLGQVVRQRNLPRPAAFRRLPALVRDAFASPLGLAPA